MISYLSAPRWAAAFAVAAVMGLAGCATTATGAADIAADIAIGREPRHRAIDRIAATDLLPPVDSSVEAVFTRGPNAGRRVTYQVSAGDDGVATHDLVGYNISRYRYEPRGIVVESERDREENANVQYDPPLLLMPAILRAGQTYESAAVATIFDLQTGERQKVGRIDLAVTLLGGADIHTPAGTFAAVLVHTRRNIALGLVHIEINQHDAFAPGVGRVANHIGRKVRILGIPVLDREDEMRLAR